MYECKTGIIKSIMPIVAMYKNFTETPSMGFPGGAVLKNPPANAGDTGWSPCPGSSHMPWSN